MIDLHTHSTFSDGSLTPEELVTEAIRQNLSALALTDHDTVTGIPRFLEACHTQGLTGIPGIEFSVDDELSGGGQIHLIGLFIDHTSTEIDQYAHSMKQYRIERNEKIVHNLQNLGVEISVGDVAKESRDGVLGRTHIARVLIQKKVVSSIQQAFDHFIGPGKPAFVPKPRFKTEEIIQLIRNAGGLAILAHPIYLNFKSVRKLENFIHTLSEYGLDGVEIFYPNTPKRLVHRLLRIADQLQLLISGGSDFHGKSNRPEINLGTGRGDLYIPDCLLEEMEDYRKKNYRKSGKTCK